MKKDYLVCGDIFIAGGFVTFIVGVFLKLVGINEIILGVTSLELIKVSYWFLLFSIALSLIDIAHKGDKK
ncbi:MAG: hypothetical protein NC822_00525 [Candidatus Omnitrophica bacterium]|nr:hypothetical protein [Candidatus Omnitrophota bacterium]MCM8826544.1 hypothetical protein [Candidatus Omnitrophota bacterium]